MTLIQLYIFAMLIITAQNDYFYYTCKGAQGQDPSTEPSWWLLVVVAYGKLALCVYAAASCCAIVKDRTGG